MDKNVGFYMETKPFVIEHDSKVVTAFRERAVFNDESGVHTERQMMIDGKRFYVKSFFPTLPKATPTDKLMNLIDRDTEKK